MPYISKDKRVKYLLILDHFPKIPDKGELEYCIFKLMKHYMSDKDARYNQLHDTVYAAQHCADEFRRRFLDERENKAIIENGDI